ncbi:MAG: hypothetical protein NC402_04100 [Prevotella sp.]|nr:hypothetical protein [Prevotella sp.]
MQPGVKNAPERHDTANIALFSQSRAIIVDWWNDELNFELRGNQYVATVTKKIIIK